MLLYSYFIDRNFDEKNVFVCFGGLTMNEVSKKNSIFNAKNYYYFSTSLKGNERFYLKYFMCTSYIEKNYIE